MNKSPVTEETTDTAIVWFARLQASDVTDRERESFFNWLQQAQEHQQAFVDVLTLWEGMSVVKMMDFEELRPFPQLWDYKQEATLSAVS